MNKWKEGDKRKPNPKHNTNILSKWFFCWTLKIFRLGLRQELCEDNLYATLPNLESSTVYNSLIKHWNIEKNLKKPRLLHMIFRAFGWHFVPACILYSLLELTVHTFQPLFLARFVSYFSEPDENQTHQNAYLYATGICLCSLSSTIFFHPFLFFLFETATRIRLACAGLVYNKCLRSAAPSDSSYMNSYAIALLAIDLPAYDEAFYFFHRLWQGPLEAIVFAIVIYMEAGWQAIVGIVAMICFLPLQLFAAKAVTKFKFLAAEYSDERIKLMNEIISAIQVIKMYVWESYFEKLVAHVRKCEIKALKGYLNVIGMLRCAILVSRVSLFFSLLTYIYTGNIVTSSKVFLLTAYHDRLNSSLLKNWLNAVANWSDIFVVNRRLEHFLQQSEDPSEGGLENFAHSNPKRGNFCGRLYNPLARPVQVTLRNLSTSWDNYPKTQKRQRHLENINLTVADNSFVGIIGNVAAGKTTLLQAILGELEILNGYVEVNGIISYAAQQPWIFEGTIRENILFVEPYDKERYNEVLSACDLRRDIEVMPYGDNTIIGERGVTLSGGQRARINLARAIYKRADIYIFDDPLSAVDSKLSKKLIDKCFLHFLADKIRIMVTHGIHHLKYSDHVVLLEDGVAEVQGTYQELKNTIRFRVHVDQEPHVEEKPRLNYAESLKRENKLTVAEKYDGRDFQERQIFGAVDFKNYVTYFKALAKPWLLVLVGLLFVISRACLALLELFVSKWSTWEESLPINEELDAQYSAHRTKLIVNYAILLMLASLIYFARTIAFFKCCLRISLKLHNLIFNGIMHANMYFFNTNSSGRILNRFSSDIGILDIKLPDTMLESFTFVMDVLAVITLVAVANYWLVIPAVISICLLHVCRNLYLATNRSLKRIENLTRSPVYSHTNQTFQGLTTIRALNATDHMEAEFHYHQNNNTAALYLFTATNRAFAFWTDLIVVLYICLVTFSFLVLNKSYSSGDVGLAISQSITLIISCQSGVRQTSDMETNMTSVERIIEFANIPSEAPLTTPESLNLPKTWPNAGHIELSKVYLKYAPKSSYVLRDITFDIRPREKIGIVGRTGAGKSSLILAIFRLAYNEGLINIDGYNANEVGLHDLRSRISIIPQEATIFSGTLRFNLDPAAQHTDKELWMALEDVHLKTYVQSLKGGLDAIVYDSGSNFSMGHRQLICLARAVLRHNTFVIMDEPTANVDAEMDKLIQETIKTKFNNCTVLIIAHRLHTVMDCDRVLVIDAGKIVEIGHAYELLEIEEGHFRKLVAHTDIGVERNLRRLARESYGTRILKTSRRTSSC